MNIVAINQSTNKVFESQSYQETDEKEAITAAITADAESSGIEVEISEMTDEEFQAAISG
jgi:hypothetical protein